MMVGMWQQAYTRARATPPETWTRGVFRPDGHSVSVSDVYFVGHHLGLVNTEIATTRSFQQDRVETTLSSYHDADIVLKCIGFQINEGNERLLGRATMSADGAVEHGLSTVVEPHLDESSNGLPLIGHVNAINWVAKCIVASLRESIGAGASRPLSIVGEQRVRLNHVTASESGDALLRATAESSTLHSRLMEHVHGIATNCHKSWTPESYLESNKRLWNALNQLLLPRAIKNMKPSAGPADSMPYPFEHALQVLALEAPALLQSAQQESCSRCTECSANRADSTFVRALSSLSKAQRRSRMETEIFSIARELTGGLSFDAELPLMEAGIDSLGATEFSSKLQNLAGIEISPTLLFEQPTLRVLATHLVELVSGVDAEDARVDESTRCGSIQAPADRSNVDLNVTGCTGSWAGGCGSVAGCMLLACGDAVGFVLSL